MPDTQPDPPEPQQLLSILSDQPADVDGLNFSPYAQTLADIIADPQSDTPLTIGVFGSWGQGKTSLMRMVQRRLDERRNSDENSFPVQTVWFNAWLYSHQPVLWRALISRVLDGVRDFQILNGSQHAPKTLQRLEARLYGTDTPAAGHLTLPPDTLPGLQDAALPPLMGLELLRRQAERANDEKELERLKTLIADVEASEALTRRDQIAALDDFRREFETLSREFIVQHGRLAVFIDDLDRCLPDKAVAVLEAVFVKLFLDVPGCIFVLGVAREVIEEGIRVRYADYQAHLDGAHYLEKIIQIPFSLPPIAADAVAGYVQHVTGTQLPDERCETVFTAGLEPNPRRIKRTLNIFLLLWRLSQNRPDLTDLIKPVRLAKIVIIQQYHPDLFNLITAAPHHLIDLEERFRHQSQEARPDDPELTRRGTGAGDPADEEISAGPLTNYLNRSLLRVLLTCTGPEEAEANFADIGPAGVREYIYLTRSTVEEGADAAETPLPFEPQMVTISAGPFLMGTPESEIADLEKLGRERKYLEREVPQHEVHLPAYAIGRYPVTNAEFARFIEEAGYQTRDFWTEAGWQRKEKESWQQPRTWDDGQWNGSSQPVVGVSWYEAVAYCNWLAQKTDKPYRLPSEAEWEKAARSPDGRRYPWGNDWAADRCNNKESGSEGTTPVGQYPTGDSVYGAGDMVGQVWEWCSTRWGDYEGQPKFGYPYQDNDEREDLEVEDSRILRGGSWAADNPAAVCRCGYRFRVDPWNGDDSGGFRCARTLSSS